MLCKQLCYHQFYVKYPWGIIKETFQPLLALFDVYLSIPIMSISNLIVLCGRKGLE